MIKTADGGKHHTKAFKTNSTETQTIFTTEVLGMVTGPEREVISEMVIKG